MGFNLDMRGGPSYQRCIEATWFSSSVPTAMVCVFALHAMDKIDASAAMKHHVSQ